MHPSCLVWIACAQWRVHGGAALVIEELFAMQHGINVNGSRLLIHRHLPFVPCWDIGRTAWGGHRRITGADEQRDFAS